MSIVSTPQILARTQRPNRLRKSRQFQPSEVKVQPRSRFLFLQGISDEVDFVVSTSTLGSKLGTGGMETKLIAAEIATGAGVSVVITSSRRPENIFDIIQYNQKSLPIQLNSSQPSAPDVLPSVQPQQPLVTPSATGTNTPIRPPHTLFRPATSPLADIKSWTAHTLYPAGSVVIDSGAHNVLSRRESGGRLLAVGVVAVLGTFAAGQAVRIVVRKLKAVAMSTTTTVTTKEAEQTTITITETTSTATQVGTGSAEGSPNTVPVPDSPHLKPIQSHSSSMSSLDPLSRSVSMRSIYETLSKLDQPAAEAVDGDDLTVTTTAARFFTPEDPNSPPPQDPELDVMEVGRGLANYNSAEIGKVRGMKRYGHSIFMPLGSQQLIFRALPSSSQIQQVIGYADSEYVVENITIRVAPLGV